FECRGARCQGVEELVRHGIVLLAERPQSISGPRTARVSSEVLSICFNGRHSTECEEHRTLTKIQAVRPARGWTAGSCRRGFSKRVRWLRERSPAATSGGAGNEQGRETRSASAT